MPHRNRKNVRKAKHIIFILLKSCGENTRLHVMNHGFLLSLLYICCVALVGHLLGPQLSHFLSIKPGEVLWTFTKIKEILMTSISTRWWDHDDEDDNIWSQVHSTRFYSGHFCTKFNALTIHTVSIIFLLFWYGNGNSEY